MFVIRNATARSNSAFAPRVPHAAISATAASAVGQRPAPARHLQLVASQVFASAAQFSPSGGPFGELHSGSKLLGVWMQEPVGIAGAQIMELVDSPPALPHAVLSDAEPGVLYVRLSGPHAPQTLAVLTDVETVIKNACAAPSTVERIVLVGTDAFFAHGVVGAELGIAALGRALITCHALGIAATWRTRAGVIDSLSTSLVSSLMQAASTTTVEVGLPALDDELCETLEGHKGAPAAARLRLMRALTSRGVRVRALVDPLVPMLTDQQGALDTLMAALAEAEVHDAAVRYIVLTPARAKHVAARLVGMRRALIQGVFGDEPWHAPQREVAHGEVHKRVPGHLRRLGHHRAIEAGLVHGIHVEVLDALDGNDSMPPGVVAPEPQKRRREPKRRDKAAPQLSLFAADKPAAEKPAAGEPEPSKE